MGKEAKIGLGVILILLVTLGVVLARKLGTAGEEGKSPASDTTTAKSAEGPGDSSKTDGRTKTPISKGTRPTVIEAKSGKTTASKPRSSPIQVGQWSVVADAGTPKQQSAGTTIPSAPPSFMPNAPSSGRSAGRYDPYKAIDPTGRTAAAWQMGQSAAGTGYRGSSGLGSQAPSGYRPTQPSNPARQTDLSSPPLPAVPNPLRGSTGAVNSPQTLRTPQTSTTGYRSSTYGSASSRSSGYATSGTRPYTQETSLRTQAPVRVGSARSTYTPTRPSAQPVSQHGAGSSLVSGSLKTRYSPRDGRREDGTYEVQPNDTFWRISETLYGNGAYFKALAEHNREKYPQEDKLDVGDVILAPTQAELEQTYPELCPTRQHAETARRRASMVSTAAQYGTGPTYVVQEGDTLYDIARWELGKSTRWTEIYDLNQDILGADPDHLPPGTTLKMPGGQPADTVTQRPSRSYRR